MARDAEISSVVKLECKVPSTLLSKLEFVSLVMDHHGETGVGTVTMEKLLNFGGCKDGILVIVDGGLPVAWC